MAGKIGLAVFGLVVLGLILTGAYYAEDLQTYIRLEAWNTSKPEAQIREFVRLAKAGDKKAAEMLDTGWVQPDLKKGKLVGLKYPGPGGPVTVAVAKIIPTDQIKQIKSRVKMKAGKLEVALEYANGKWAAFTLSRPGGQFKVAGVPSELSDSRPKPQSWD